MMPDICFGESKTFRTVSFTRGCNLPGFGADLHPVW